MAQRVVDRLQAIDIQYQYGELSVELCGPRERRVRCFGESDTIRQAGERIGAIRIAYMSVDRGVSIALVLLQPCVVDRSENRNGHDAEREHTQHDREPLIVERRTAQAVGPGCEVRCGHPCVVHAADRQAHDDGGATARELDLPGATPPQLESQPKRCE